MAGIKIETPDGCIVKTKDGKAELKWANTFAANRTQGFNSAQKYIDSEVLRYDAALVPFDTGMLQKSGTLGTVVGSGEVNYIASYARAQYDTKQTRSYDKDRGGKWFERMKTKHKADIKKGAGKFLK